MTQSKEKRRSCISILRSTRPGMFNVVLHGIAFMVIFSAFQTASEYAQPILKDQDLGELGFESAAIIYLSLAAANLVAPAFVNHLGAKRSMIGGASLYLVYLTAYLKPTRFRVLAASVILGVGGAVLWTAQGIFLIENSNHAHRGRDAGIFWSLLQCRLLIGNSVAFFTLGGDNSSGSTTIDAEAAHRFFVLLLCLGTAGVMILFCLRPQPQPRVAVLNGREGGSPESQAHTLLSGSGSSLRAMGRLLTQQDVRRLVFCFCYTGLILTFWSGKYFALMAGHVDVGDGTITGTGAGGSSVAFGAEAVAVGGLCLGAGEIVGGLTTGVLGDRCGRTAVFATAVACHLVAVLLSLVVFADQAWSTQLFPSPVEGGGLASIRLLTGYTVGFLLGLGDSGLNTSIYALLGALARMGSGSQQLFGGPTTSARTGNIEGGVDRDPTDQAQQQQRLAVPLIALFKLVQSSAAASAFFFTGTVGLNWQITLLTFFGVGSLFLFTVVNDRVQQVADYDRPDSAVTTLQGSPHTPTPTPTPTPTRAPSEDDALDEEWEAGRTERLKFLS